MAGFVIKVIAEGLKYTARGSKYIGGLAVETAPVIIRPARDFTVGFVKQAPRQVAIGGLAEGTTATVSVALRAGIQTRYLAGLAVNTAVVKAPAVGVRVIKYVGQEAVRDTVISPIYTPFLVTYRAFTLAARNRGYVGAVERALEPTVLSLNRRLHVAGLAPTLGGFTGSAIRSALGYSLYIGIDKVGDKIDEIHATARRYLDSAEKSLDERGVSRPSGTSPTYLPSASDGGVPVVPPPVPALPAVPAAPAPVPASRQRRYIPVER